MRKKSINPSEVFVQWKLLVLICLYTSDASWWWSIFLLVRAVYDNKIQGLPREVFKGVKNMQSM